MKTRAPDRLLDSSSNEVERLLLRAGREGAPRGAKRRAIAAATGVIAASTLSAGTAGGAAVAGKTGAGVATFLSLKWVVVVGVASVSVAAGTAAVRAVQAERAEARATATAASTRARVMTSSASSASSRVAARTVPPTVAASEASEATAPASVTPVAAAVTTPIPAAPAVPAARVALPPPAPDLAAASHASAPPSALPNKVSGGPTSSASSAAAELAMLDKARGAIRDGVPAESLSILDTYRARFPHGAMGPEASILRVEALVRAGDRDGAKREGDAFLRANPNSPYAARIESLLSAPNP